MRCRVAVLVVFCVLSLLAQPAHATKKKKDPKVAQAVTRALDYLAREQRRQGYWEANQGQYRVAMTALAGNALLAEGSTTTRGKYAKNIRRAKPEPGATKRPAAASLIIASARAGSRAAGWWCRARRPPAVSAEAARAA